MEIRRATWQEDGRKWRGRRDREWVGEARVRDIKTDTERDSRTEGLMETQEVRE